MAKESLELDHRIRYERLIGELTQEALKRQPLMEFVRTALRRLGEVLRVSRVYLFEYHRDKGVAVNVAEWIGKGVSPSLAEAGTLIVDRFPWLRDQLLAGKDVRVEDFRAAKDEHLRALMKEEQTKSLLCLPFNVFGVPYGFVGFDECRTFRRWKEEDIELLRSACRIMAQVIEKDRWESEVVNVERMAAMGRLAGAVAHEINNPLQAMLLHLDLIRPAVAENESAKRNLQHIEEGIRRISEIVWRILNLHRERADMEDVDINDIIRGALMLLERHLERANCACVLNLADDLPTVKGMRQMLHQMVLNILVNAMESVCASGVIEVASRSDGGTVVVEIRDNGVGIKEGHLPHIFEPFFSSKIPPRSGLGLFIAHAVVTNHGGTIAIDSQEGVGTTVTIRLPARVH